jgi:defect-in-organelle-trafficking protein DotB
MSNEVQSILFKSNVSRYTPDMLEDILEHAFKIKSSDIHIQSNEPIKVEIHGRLKPITDRRLDVNEVETFIKKIYGDNAITELNQARAIDKSMAILNRETNKKVRFRVNAVNELSRGGVSGLQITIRTIDSTPPHISMMNLEAGIWDNFVPSQGLIVVTGPTGSGKSTLLSSCIRAILEEPDPEKTKKIVTYESPIEFVYDEVEKGNNLISQTELPTHLKTWHEAVESAMRRKPNIILIGESRDPDTIRSSILASQTGHLVYTTAHTNGVAETIRRMVNVFDPEERSALQYDLIDSLKMVVSQRLLKTVDGKRVPVREYLNFTTDIKDRLFSIDDNLVAQELRSIVKEKKQSLLHDSYRKYKEGRISDDEWDFARRSFGGSR